WGLVAPYGVGRTVAAERNAEIGAIALVRAVGGVIRPLEERHVDILARDVLGRGIGRFAERQSFSGVGDDPPCDSDHHPAGVALDRYRMIRPGNFDRLRCSYYVLFHG